MYKNVQKVYKNDLKEPKTKQNKKTPDKIYSIHSCTLIKVGLLIPSFSHPRSLLVHLRSEAARAAPRQLPKPQLF